MRQLASTKGLYSLLPLGERVVRKVERIIDAAMHSVGGCKVTLPLILPAELWKTTGRWESTGEELFRLKDRRRAEMCLAPTHEEAITALVAANTSSWRHLPLRIYQTGKKYRDEGPTKIWAIASP